MEAYPEYLLHSGQWTNDNKFVNFVADCIAIGSTFNFENLVKAISKQIRLDTQLNALEIKFVPRDGLMPILVYNDTGVQVYIELKKKNPEFTDFALYVTVKKVENDSVAISSSGINRGNFVQEVDTIDMIENESDNEYIENKYFGIIDDMLHKEVEEDQVYKNKETVVSVMHNYVIQNNFQFKVKRSSKSRYHLSCVDEDCVWFFKSSAIYKAEIFKVRSFNNVHTCSFSERFLTQRHATSKVVASIIKDKCVDPKTIYTANDIISRGGRSSNPGTITKLHKSEDGRFLYVFVSLFACIKRWEYCRPIMVVVGRFLKAAYKGTILTACTQDGAGELTVSIF
ncbi:uncharacterized protein LOC132046121 [Lycium ferocissimum]|uniref:uncharacterized protein LOC132046121 n=1 Tax=Lycium ferocissimum TaxID=112874 RepID=UPI002815E3BC|nr:uncharacterized protein LOC132046121 [Lycium ferocissimum]